MKTKKNWLLTLVVLCIAILSFCALFTACKDPTTENKPTLTEITLDTSNADLVFDLNEEFSSSGLLIKANYSDNTTKAIFTQDCQISTPDMSTKGEKTVTVIYEDKSADYKITVRAFKSITVDTTAVKTRFNLNETFVYDGLIVYAEYEDGVASATVTDYTVSTPDLSTFGEKTVTVTYKGQTAEYTVSVANAPAINTATIIEQEEKLYLKLTGSAQGFAADQITLDLQEMFGAWERVQIQADAQVNADGTFEVLGNISDSAMTDKGDYMIHIFFAGEQFDVVDIQTKADQTVSFGGLSYQIKSEQWFDNNTSYFVVLRCGNEADFSEKAYCEVTAASLEVKDGRVYYVISGNYAVYTESDFSVDVENISSWTKTVISSVTTTLDAKNGTFSVAADVTDVLTADNFLSHLLVSNKSLNLMNLEGFTEKSVTVGGKTYSLTMQDVFGNGTDFYLVLTAQTAENEE